MHRTCVEGVAATIEHEESEFLPCGETQTGRSELTRGWPSRYTPKIAGRQSDRGSRQHTSVTQGPTTLRVRGMNEEGRVDVGREGRARNRDSWNRRRQLTFCHEHDRYLIWWPLSSSIWFLTIACSSSLEMLEPVSDTFFAAFFTSYSSSAMVSARDGSRSCDVEVVRRVRLESRPETAGGRRTSQGRSPVARRGGGPSRGERLQRRLVSWAHIGA